MRVRLLLASVATALYVSVSYAATLRVPEDYGTVLEATDLAMPGDTVKIGPGIWTDTDTRVVGSSNGPLLIRSCAFLRGGVFLQGSGVGVTTLDGNGTDTAFGSDVVLIQRLGEGPVTLESMTLAGVADGDAVLALFSDGLRIRSCRFEGAAGDSGRAVESGECPLVIEDCDMVGFATRFGAVHLLEADLDMLRCTFEENLGRCVQLDGSGGPYAGVIRECMFIRNRGNSAVCINLQNTTSYVVEQCTFVENVAELGLGAGIRSSGSAGEIRFNVFAYDSCLASNSVGGGVILEGGIVETRSNTFVGCYAGLNGAAYTAAFGAVGDFRQNVIARSPRPAVRFAAGTTIEGGCNLFWENMGGDFGGGGTPDSTDVFADPLFCDLDNLDFTVQLGSPCLAPPTPACAPIGALGLGCGPVSVQPSSFGRIKAMFR